MLSKEKWNDICMEIYRELYKLAEPSADIDTLIESKDTLDANWFNAYYLGIDKQCEVIERICKSHKIKKYDIGSMKTCILLGSSPCSCKETVDRYRQEKKFGGDKL